MLHGVLGCSLILGLVGWAGLALGLFLSAVAGRYKPVASFLLPLVMIAQIVFSVQVAGRGDAPLHEAYGELNLHRCQGAIGCQRRAQFWIPQEDGRWVCDKCQTSQLRATRKPDPAADRDANRLRPGRWAALASYLTISRYADIALRSFAYHEVDFTSFSNPSTSASYTSRAERFGYGRWRQEAAAVLVAWTAVVLLATVGWLRWEHRLRRIGRKVYARFKKSEH